MDKLDTIIKAIKVILGANDITASGDSVLDSAVRIYNTERINANKGPASSGSAIPISVNNSATPKQIATLGKFGIEHNANITKQEASQLISRKIDSLNN